MWFRRHTSRPAANGAEPAAPTAVFLWLGIEGRLDGTGGPGEGVGIRAALTVGTASAVNSILKALAK